MPYDDKVEYYSYLKELLDAGYRRIIVTSEAMIQLIQKIVLKGFRVSEIVLMDDEDDVHDQIHVLLERINSNPAYLAELVSLLDMLAEKSSIGIQRVVFMGRGEDRTSVEGFVQSNGLIGANGSISDKVFCAVGETVGEYVFGC